MKVELSKLKPAVLSSTWCELDAIVLEDDKGVLVIRTPDDNMEKLLEAARAVDSVLADAGIRYLVVPYSVEFLSICMPEGGIKRFRRKIAAFTSRIIDILYRIWLW